MTYIIELILRHRFRRCIRRRLHQIYYYHVHGQRCWRYL